MDTQTLSAPRAQSFTPANHSDLTTTAPGLLKVIRRNGTVTPFDANKITGAVKKAFLAVEGEAASGSTRIYEKASLLTKKIAGTFARRLPSGGTLHIEEVQDQVELELMRTGEYKVAKAYVLYREERRKVRAQEQQQKAADSHFPILQVTLDDGHVSPLDFHALSRQVQSACIDLNDVSPELIIEDVRRNLF